MAHINIVILHGIGKNEIGYADDLVKGIEKEFNTFLERITGQADNGTVKLIFKPIVWDDILDRNQGQLKVILERALAQKQRISFLRFWTGIGILPIAIAIWLFVAVFKHPVILLIAALISGYLLYRFGTKLYYQLRTGFASEFVMDIIGYLNRDAQKMIQDRIKEDLKSINGDKEPVTFIAHSLGTVIASDFIWDRQNEKDFGDFKLSNFFTMGSPIALFALRWGAELFNKPIRMDDPNGCWINILDKDDPIAYPLKELNKEYKHAVLADEEINVGPLGVAHVKYWKSEQVHKIIAHKLAKDWVRMNGKNVLRKSTSKIIPPN
ncbi:MAG: DDHD family phospholipase [Candidatus Omnitrophica bacterium]|nr:DDHD family phospholipase [Candidatus Omnitrophota bacterium]